MNLDPPAGLHALLDEQLRVACPNPGVKATSVIAGLAAGADCIDDLDLLRNGGTGRLFSGIRAPSTLALSCGRSPSAMCGSWTRSGRFPVPGS